MTKKSKKSADYFTRTVEDFFDTEYRNYAIYTVENRAIPSLIDGFKPSQRKIAFAANKLWKTGNEKPMKVFQLGGRAAAMSFFHHGSLDSTIIGMAQKFKNSIPIFEGIGQFGSLRTPEAGAPRYVGVRFNENFRLLYRDFDLCKPKFEEGEEIEPEYFLPIIPTVLLNGGSGIAVGFATNILNRHPLEIIDACIDTLNNKPSRKLRPWLAEFHGEINGVIGTGRSWTFQGYHKVKNTTTVEVTELPPSFTYEKYEAYLDSLIDSGKIVSYEDHSSERPQYTIKFQRAKLALLVKRNRLASLLKMQEQQGENITTLDEHGQIKTFDTAEDLLKYFVEFRLGVYQQRKDLLVSNLNNEIKLLGAKARFIKAIIDKEIVVANKPKAQIIDQIIEVGIKKVNGNYDYLLSMPIYTLTFEKYQELLNKVQNKEHELEVTKKKEPKDFYLEDLNSLKSQVKKVVKAR